jgi:hypothetical protein
MCHYAVGRVGYIAFTNFLQSKSCFYYISVCMSYIGFTLLFISMFSGYIHLQCTLVITLADLKKASILNFKRATNTTCLYHFSVCKAHGSMIAVSTCMFPRSGNLIKALILLADFNLLKHIGAVRAVLLLLTMDTCYKGSRLEV